jgi:hypothetical protein
MPISEWINQLWFTCTRDYLLLSNKKAWTTETCNSTDGSQVHYYTKWNNSDPRARKLYSFIMWHSGKDRLKEAKNNQCCQGLGMEEWADVKGTEIFLSVLIVVMFVHVEHICQNIQTLYLKGYFYSMQAVP